MSNKSYKDKLILITGAGSGIGRALSENFAQCGAVLALVGRHSEALTSVSNECIAAGSPEALVVPFDLTHLDNIEDLIARVQTHFKRPIDTVIHCAGVGLVGLIEDIPMEEISNCLAVNLIAAIGLARAVLPSMRSHGSGELVFITSGAGHYGVPTESIYCASKSGLERIIEGLRIELIDSGITVCSISPGPVETALMRSPKTYGKVRLMSRVSVALSPNEVAKRIIKRLNQGEEDIVLSLRSRMVRHIQYWAPSALRRLFSKQFQQNTGI